MGETAGLPQLGKLPPDVFSQVIYPNLGKKNPRVVVPPTSGVDFGVVELADGALIIKTDPVFIVPEYGWEKSAWFAVHILASDVAVSGSPPMYMAIDLNLPRAMKREEFELMWKGISLECERLGISIVAGHTGVYEGTGYPMLGGATVLSVAPRDGYVTTQMARPGDKVLITKGPAVEATGIFSSMFHGYLEKRYGADFADRAAEAFYQMSVVRDALTLAKIGLRSGVTSMHDATEYGVWGALWDIAEASKNGILVQEDALIVPDEIRAVLDSFSELTGIKADPFACISEGTLVATVRPEKEGQAIQILKEAGIRAWVIGEVTRGPAKVQLAHEGKVREVQRPAQDPFWPMFSKALQALGKRQTGCVEKAKQLTTFSRRKNWAR